MPTYELSDRLHDASIETVTQVDGSYKIRVAADLQAELVDHEARITEIEDNGAPPGVHAPTHQNGGADEINVAGLSGVLADPQTPATHASMHENGGAGEISVAGLSGVLSDPQVTDKIKESSGPTTLTVGAVADGQALVRSGSTIAGANIALAAPIRRCIWFPPTSANSDDDEFSTGSLAGAWSWYSGVPNGALTLRTGGSVIPIAALTMGISDAASPGVYDPARRTSWMYVQPTEASSTHIWLLKPITAVNNMALQTGVYFPYAGGPSNTANKARLMFVLLADSAGVPTAATGVGVGIRFTATDTISLFSTKWVGGVETVNADVTTTVPPCINVDYMGIQRLTDTYHPFAGFDGGYRKPPSQSLSPTSWTPAWVGFYFGSATTATAFPGYGIDFLRRVDAAGVLPW